jgi:DNA-binding transcriptional LysR family regulator
VNQYFLANPGLFKISIEAYSLHVVEKMARIGAGFAVLPVSHTIEGMEKGQLAKVTALEVNLPPRPVYLACLKSNAKEKWIRELRSITKQVLGERA